MYSSLYKILFVFILIAGVVWKSLPLLTGNFYFTTDQGRDVIYAREILSGRLFPLVGPETSVPGVYHGALWYYFVAAGLLIAGGHPAGPVFLLIVMHSVVLSYLVFILSRKISPWWGIGIGLAVSISWGFYDSSRYAFNPFPLSVLAILILVFISRAWEGEKRVFLWAGVAAGLGFHSHIVGAIPLYICVFTAGLILLFLRRTIFMTFISGIAVASLFMLPHALSEIVYGFPQLVAVRSEYANQSGFFSLVDPVLTRDFLSIIGSSVIPQLPEAGTAVFLAISVLAVLPNLPRRWAVSPNSFTRVFVASALLLFVITYLWYASGSYWRSWQTIFLPPVILIATLLGLTRIPKVIGILFFIIIVAAQMQYLGLRLGTDNRRDVSYLANQLNAIQTIYTKSEGSGFEVYIYEPSVLDYTYQYLIVWYGMRTYGYLPCENSSYPGSPKLFIPGSKNYKDPAKPCSGLRFLILSPDTVHPELREKWVSELRKGDAIEKFSAGEIDIELVRNY